MTTESTGRLIAIGDIHGCSRALQTMLEKLAPGPADTLVVLGDMVDRGPDSEKVIRQLLALQGKTTLIALLGNHEEMLLAVADGHLSPTTWTRHGGEQVLTSYGVDHPAQIPRQHLDFLRSAQLFHEQGSHLFAHACYLPQCPLAKTPREVLLWDFANPGELQPHCSGKAVVLGHTTQPDGDILDLGFVTLIDTGCCQGGWLTALDLTTGRVYQANEKGKLHSFERPIPG